MLRLSGPRGSDSEMPWGPPNQLDSRQTHEHGGVEREHGGQLRVNEPQTQSFSRVGTQYQGGCFSMRLTRTWELWLISGYGPNPNAISHLVTDAWSLAQPPLLEHERTRQRRELGRFHYRIGNSVRTRPGLRTGPP